LVQRHWTGIWTSCIHFYVAVFSVAGLRHLWSTHRDAALALAVWFVFGLTAPFLLHVSCPWRFFLVVELLGCAVAAVGMDAWSGKLLPQKFGPAFLVVAAVAAMALWHNDSTLGIRARKDTLTADQAALIDYFRSRPDRSSGRFLVECEIKFDPHVLDLAPSLAGVHVLGGSNSTNFLKSRFTVFSGFLWNSTGTARGEYRPNVFGQQLAQMTEDDFARELTLYNVHEVLAWSGKARADLARFENTLEPAGTAGGYQIFRVKHPASWFVEGGGRLEAFPDRLHIADATPGKIVLSFHWIRTLSARDAKITPVVLPGSPLPFIQVDNAAGLRDIDIVNAGL
jgi:hypothetical protein